MKRHICTSCGTEIPRGEAVLRSVNFRLVAWHRECAELELVSERVA